MLKKTLFFISTALIVCALLFSPPVFKFIVEWYLKGYCQECLGGDLQFQRFYKEDGVWIVEKPEVISFKSLGDGGHHFHAEKALISPTISWIDRKLFFDIKLLSPEVDVGDSAANIKELFFKSRADLPFFQVASNFSIPKGKITLHEFHGNGLEHTLPLSFQLDIACDENTEACFSLKFEEDQENWLKVALKDQGENKQLSLNFDGINGEVISHALNILWPEFNHWTVSQGIINGSLNLKMVKENIVFEKGEITVNGLNFFNPILKVNGSFPEVRLQLLDHSSARLEMPKGTLLFYKDKIPTWEIENTLIDVFFNHQDEAKVVFQGLCRHEGKENTVHIAGDVKFSDEFQASMNFGMKLKKQNQEDVSAQIFTRQLGALWNFIEIDLVNFGAGEFDFFQNILGDYFPQWNKVRIYQGKLSATLLMYLQNYQITEFQMEKMAINNLVADFDPWEVSLEVNESFGGLSVDLSRKNILETLNGNFYINKGNLTFIGLDREKWKLSDIHTNLAIKNGVLQKSLIKGAFAGLKGAIEIDLTDPKQMVKLDFSGGTLDVANLLPESIKKGINKNFSQDRLDITATASHKETGLGVNGKMLIQGQENKGQEVVFGFDLEKTSFPLWQQWPPHAFSQAYWLEAGSEIIRSVLPPIALPAALLQGDWLQQELGVLGFMLRNGWFKTQNLSFERYLAPFAFPEGLTKLSGTGDLEGVFDYQGLTVNYDAKNVILENKDLAIDLKSISVSDGENPVVRLPAMHYFDFIKGTDFGTIPLKNGSYFEKNTGLLFTDVNALVHLEKASIYTSEIETFCNGVYFSGSINSVWDLSQIGVFSVDVNLQAMNGKVSQIQHILSHFNKPFFFLKFPLEGNVGLQPDGGYLHFDFNPIKYQMKALARGTLTDGVLACQTADVSLQELNMNFDYNYDANTFQFTDVQGTLLVGKPNHVEEYNFAGDHIRFTDYTHNEGEFDLWVGDKKRDIFRLVGKTQALEIKEEGSFIGFTLNPTLSHFGDVHPANFQLTMKDWSQVHLFHLDLDFQLGSLLQDLQRFSRSGLFFLSRHFLKELNDLKTAVGNFKLSLDYDNKQSLFTYNGSGKDISVGENKFDTFQLIGKKKDASWIIDQLQLDHISLAADFHRMEEDWKINFLGARIGESLLLGLEGKYLTNENAIEGDVNLLEVNLGLLGEWPRLADFVRDYRTAGIMRGVGKARFELSKADPGFRVEADLTAALRSCEYKGLRLQDAENANVHFISDKGIVIRDVKTALKSFKDDSIKSAINLEKCEYSFVNRECRVDGLHFSVPSENLGWLAENLQQSFPDGVTQPVADTLKNIKSGGNFEGTLKVEISNPHCAFHLALKEGSYSLFNKEHQLNHFILDYDPFGFKVVSQYRYQNHLFWLTGKSSAPNLDFGELIFSDILPSDQRPNQMPLTVFWQMDPSHGLIIQKAEGLFAGLSLDFKRDPEESLAKNFLAFKGSMKVDFSRAKVLLPKEMARTIVDWEIGKGYSLKGKWQFGKDSNKNLMDQINFFGELDGDNFEFLGYQFLKLKGDVNCQPGKIKIDNFSMTDPCGSLEMGEIQLVKAIDANWYFDIPNVLLNEFRPSLLHAAKAAQVPLGKALVVRQLHIQALKGILGSKETFTGSGNLYFANTAKKNLHNILFAIPGEILSRIGLDLRVLNPVMGTIFYEIRNAKVYLTRFKDIYSEGRLSKFYLPNTSYESYMDFKGNLHLQVRMKQYNLLFKLAELFTVTIQGTLKKPTYSLQKQNHQPPNPKEIVLEKN